MGLDVTPNLLERITTGRKTQLLFVAGLAFIAITAFIGFDTRHKIGPEPFDFSLYYSGGVVERSGTYTDTLAVRSYATAHGWATAKEGVYGTPTLVGLIFQPLSFLPYDLAKWMFMLSGVAFLAYAVYRAVDSHHVWWIGVALASEQNWLAFALGNFAIFTTALIVLAYGALRRNDGRTAGIALGVAIACKLYPVLFLVPLIVRREWTAVKWAAATTIAFFAVTPFALGLHDTRLAIDQMASVTQLINSYSDNIGIPGFLVRTTENEELARWIGRAMTVSAITTIYFLRRVPTPALLAVAAPLVLLSQSISWGMYWGISVLTMLAILERTRNIQFVGWTVLAYLLINGVCSQPTYELFGMPRGLPLTIGAVAFTGLAVLCIATKTPQVTPTGTRSDPDRKSVSG